MPSDEHKGQIDSFEYGASVTGEAVDFSPDSGIESAGVRDRVLMDKLREALRPGDAKNYSQGSSNRNNKGGSGGGGLGGSSGGGGLGVGVSDTTHDGRHGGIESTMKPGNRDYDEREERMARGGVLDAIGDSTHDSGRNRSRRGSILDHLPLGQHQQHQSQQRPYEGSNARPQEGGGGPRSGMMESMKDKTNKAADHIESFRDSTDSKRADEGRLPGNLYSSIRDDAFK